MTSHLEEKTKKLIKQLEGVSDETKRACDKKPVNNINQACLLLADVFCHHPKAMKPSNKKRLMDYAKSVIKLASLSECLEQKEKNTPTRTPSKR